MSGVRDILRTMGTIETVKIRELLRKFDFRHLLIELLGWDRHSQTLDIKTPANDFRLTAVAQKRGLVVFLCESLSIPDHPTRRLIETQVAKSVLEHIIIYTNAARTNQVWQWVRREQGKPSASREHAYHISQSGEALIQKLQALAFSLQEEDELSLIHVNARVRSALDVEKVTKRFYERFKIEHAQFLKFIKGIPDEEMHRWYASVMINRLMFIYFIQQKGFLNGDQDYLRTKLAESKQRGNDLYYSGFLCPLFFSGFAEKEKDRSPATKRLLGDVPYLNGGLFLRHQIEELHGKAIKIADAAFDKIFEFFKAYSWHLDERPLRNDREISPDVLGYIFEKYINQKQMGAYYTKEDISEYIGKNTIIPCLFDKARQKSKIAFEADSFVWRLLRQDPDRYIYKPIRHGVTWDVHENRPLERPIDMPTEIAIGLDTSKPDLIARRANWNKPAPPEVALPTEIWREVVTRRQRYNEVREKLASGKIRDINDLITYNLDIRQFAEDVIANCEGPELLRAFWRSIVGRIPERSNEKFENGLSVLDPTCGSGAFLFAALNILEPLYDACLNRMQVFLDDLERSGESRDPKKFNDFRTILDRVDQHPNHRYFVLKSIIVNNLFGVDIMEEAVEICKLRLFLKLVAQIDRGEQIEPLPDIDFNIRAGNTLVGYATLDEVKRAVESKFDFDNALARIEEKAEDLDRLLNLFRQQQTQVPAHITVADKAELRRRLSALEGELNEHLAGEYGIELKDNARFESWRHSHKPFHWLIEFHNNLGSGGFDVVIGNPPYVEYSKVRKVYEIKGLQTERCGNLYALSIERVYQLLGNQRRFGFIVQAPIVSTQRMQPVRSLLSSNSDTLLFTTFDDRPAKLFDGMHHCRLAIILSRTGDGQLATLATTKYNKWYEVERPALFRCIRYLTLDVKRPMQFLPKFRYPLELSILEKLLAIPRHVGTLLATSPTEFAIYYKITGVGHWFTFTTRAPRFWRDGLEGRSTREQQVCFGTELVRDTVFCLLWSTLHYWLYQARTNCRDFNPGDMSSLPIPGPLGKGLPRFSELGRQITGLLDATSTTSSGNYSVGGSVRYERFKPRVLKPVIDEIDKALAPLYGLSEEELDFILNYDIKYRMGREAEDDDDYEE